MASNTGNATNSNNVPKQQPAPAPKDSLQEEQQLEDMLDRLDQVHLQASLPQQSTCHCRNGFVFSDFEMQLRQLRSAVPRMLEPLKTKHPSRSSLPRLGCGSQQTNENPPAQAAFAAFKQAVEQTNKDIASFQEATLGLQTDGTLARARASQKNPKGLKHWRASDHPDWASPDQKRPRNT
jgi:hypothetical protein